MVLDDFDWDEEEEERNQRKEESEQELQQARSDFAEDVKKFNNNLRKNQASSGTNTAKEAGEAAKKTGDAANKTKQAAQTADKASKAAKTAETAGKAAKTAETAGKAAKVGKAAVTAGKAAAGATTGPVGWVLLAVDAIKLIKAKREKSKNESFEEKFKKASPLLIILGLFVAPLAGVLMLTGSVGYEAVTYDSDMRLDEYIDCIESSNGCEDMWGFVEEEVKGKNKILIKFKDDEFDKAGKEYADISFKYFEYGEGLDFKGYDKANDGATLSEEELKEILASSISNYLAVESKAFSRVNWYVEEYQKGRKKAKLKEEFSVGSDSNSLFTWLTQLFNKPKYRILIPNPDEYSYITTTTKHVFTSLTVYDDDTTGTKGYMDANYVKGLDPDDPKKVKTPQKPFYDLDYYRKLLTGYLPEWIEPYSIYLATGDIELANSYIGIVYKLLESGEVCSLDVVLYRVEEHYIETINVKTDSETDTYKTYEGQEPKVSHSVTDQLKTDKYDIVTDEYIPVVDSGYRYNYVLISSGKYLGPPDTNDDEHSIKTKILDNESHGGGKDDYGKAYSWSSITDGTEITQRDKEQQPDSCVLKTDYDKYKTASYEGLIDDEKYNNTENAYINSRVSYIYKNYAELFKSEYPNIFKNSDGEEIDDPFNLDLIGPALKEIDDYYKKELGSSSNYINGEQIAADLSDVPEGGFAWPAGSKKITSMYGWSKWYEEVSLKHSGIDIVGAENVTPIYAAHDGTVTVAKGNVTGQTKTLDYGNWIEIDNGTYKTRYGHLSYTNSIKVKQGDYVTKGTVIGYMGNTGYSTGPHLHFEVIKNGVNIDPMLFYDYVDDNGTEYVYTHEMTQSEVQELQASNAYKNLTNDDLFQYNMRLDPVLKNHYNYKSSIDPNKSNNNDENSNDKNNNDENKENNTDSEKPNKNMSQTVTTENESSDATNHEGVKEYTSLSGITYYEWKQNEGSYIDKGYYSSTGEYYGTFRTVACPIVSTAIFLQAYGVDWDPAYLYDQYGHAANPQNLINKYTNKSAVVMQENPSEGYLGETLLSKNRISEIEEILKSGKPAVVHAMDSSSGHFLTIIDYNPTTKQIYISDVAAGYKAGTAEGWHDVGYLFTKLNINQFIYIPENESENV